MELNEDLKLSNWNRNWEGLEQKTKIFRCFLLLPQKIDYIFNRSDFEWKTENFCMEREYSLKTILPPPFSILESIVKLLLMRRFKVAEQLSIPQTDLSALAEFESRCASEVLADKNKLQSATESLEHALKVIDEQKSRLNDFEAILEEMTTLIHERNNRCRLESTLCDFY